MRAPWVLFEDSQETENRAIIAQNPIAIIRADKWRECDAALAKLQDFTAQKRHIFGYVSYEFGLGIEPSTRHMAKSDLPLLWFAVFDEIETKSFAELNQNDGFAIGKFNSEWDFKEYKNQFEKVKSYIENGDIYQANLTFNLTAPFWGSPFALYQKLRDAQPVKYSAFLDLGEFQILSLSPELFFKTEGVNIETHPMKGTIKRGAGAKEDVQNFETLKNDEKQRAENLMITDLMRNDLARISVAGSVKVPQLFAIEKYPSVFQMISKIQAQLRDSVSQTEVLTTLMPAGSIIGCPKIRATEIIAECEQGPRGIYCGAIGMIKPNGDMSFNVAIRTPIIRNGEIEIGVGSGIVYDSDARAEYDECLLKSSFLQNAARDFALIETLKWNGTAFENLDLHLTRMAKSAEFFGIEFEISKIEKASQHKAKEWGDAPARVRILTNFDNVEIEFHTFEDLKDEYKIKVCETLINSNSLWLKHKTSNREFYDLAFQKAGADGFDEVIFVNEKGEISEGSRTNIFLDFGDGILRTPKLECGVLPGVLRQKLIDEGKAIEAILKPEDLARTQIFVGNSLRGLKKAVFKT